MLLTFQIINKKLPLLKKKNNEFVLGIQLLKESLFFKGGYFYEGGYLINFISLT